MSTWNADHYLKYGDKRTRAAADLVARIQLSSPATIVDLGCGPGNSTQLLRERWPHAGLLGVDNSPEMIAAAKQEYPNQDWLVADISNWAASSDISLVYSNAAFHWLANHDVLLRRLFAMVSPGGALAFQIPSCTFPTIRELIHEISRDAAWNERMAEPRSALTMKSPSFYYDVLIDDATEVDIWETEYYHIMDSPDAIIDWISSTGLRPFLDTLGTADERSAFMAQLRQRTCLAYETRSNGKVLFPFRRTFVIAYR